MANEPTSGGDFKKAISKLSADSDYRNRAMKDPSLVTHDFKLSLSELEALRNAAELSGADLTAVRKVRASSFEHLAATPIQRLGAKVSDVNVSCCSCCCCCCGETAVAPMLRG